MDSKYGSANCLAQSYGVCAAVLIQSVTGLAEIGAGDQTIMDEKASAESSATDLNPPVAATMQPSMH